MTSQITFQGFPNLLPVITAFSQIDGGFGRGLSVGRTVGRVAAGCECLEKLGDVPRQFANLAVIFLRKLIAIIRIQFKGRAVLHGEKFIAEDVFHQRGQGVLRVHGRFQYLEDSGLVIHRRSASVIAKLPDLLGTRVRFQISRGKDGYEQGCLGKLVHDFVGKDVVPLQFIVAPDPGRLSESHAQQRRERRVEAADPAFMIGRDGLVVDVRVANKKVFIITGHNSGG